VRILIDLICGLIEQPRAQIGASFLEARGGEAERLAAIGLVRPGRAPSTIACGACDEDHAATIEFDNLAGRHFHFCPVAGRVEIDTRDLRVLEIRAGAMVDLLVAAFPVLPAINRELVAGKVWHLGEAIVGGTSLTLIFACRIGSGPAFGALASAIATVPPTEIGMIITCSPLPDPRLSLPYRYTVVSLREIASVQENRLVINQQRIAAHIRAVPGYQVRIRAGAGRPSAEELVIDAHHRRRERREPFVSNTAEARSIVSDLATAYPDRARLGVSTVRRHLVTLRSSKPPDSSIDQN
jgi:hypothetical protein